MLNEPGELSLVEGRHSLASSLAVGLRGHNPRVVGHHLPRDAPQKRTFPRGRAMRGMSAHQSAAHSMRGRNDGSSLQVVKDVGSRELLADFLARQSSILAF